MSIFSVEVKAVNEKLTGLGTRAAVRVDLRGSKFVVVASRVVGLGRDFFLLVFFESFGRTAGTDGRTRAESMGLCFVLRFPSLVE